MQRRVFLGAAAVAVGMPPASIDTVEANEPEALEDTVEWRAAAVWQDHLIPARNALTKEAPVNIEEAKEELREAVQKLESLEVDDANQ